MMDANGESKPILEKHSVGDGEKGAHGLYVYKRRWWVTFVFCLAGFTQALVWNAWGPIAESSELVFRWTNGRLAQITNMAGITFAIFVLPFGSLMDTKGLRFCMLLCANVLFIATLIRCFTLEPEIFTPLAYFSSTLQGIGGLGGFSGTVLFAAVWFPVKERASITALTSFFNYFGVAMSFIISPLMVPGPVYIRSSPINKTEINRSTPWTNWTTYTNNADNLTSEQENVTFVANMDSMRTGIKHLLYFTAGLSAVSLGLLIVYFPSKPPRAPSVTASLGRTNYKEAYKKIVCNGQLWIVVLAGALPRAVVGSWTAIFDVIAKQINVSQIDAGWISFWNTLIGCVAGIVFAKFSDFLSSRRKGLVLSMSALAVLCSIWAALLCNKLISFNMASLYASCILVGFSVHGLVPLFYEMSAETAYPVGEGVAGSFFTLAFSIFNIIFLALLSIPGIGISWMTWTCVGVLVLSLPLMAVFQERNKRYDIDIKKP